MNLYKVYNLPTLHPGVKVDYIYELEGVYLAITKNKIICCFAHCQGD